MKNITIKTAILPVLFFASVFSVSAISADEILDKVETMNVHKTSFIEGEMRITDELATRVKTFRGYTRGDDDMMIEFTNIEDRGQKILRLNGEIHLYFPSAEEIITLRGEALKDRVMGSDFSYEDLANEGKIRDKFDAALDGEEQVNGRMCYKLVLTAKPKAKDVVYPKEIIWIDKEYYVQRKGELYSLSGKLIKEFYGHETIEAKGKHILSRYEMIDAMKKSSKTEFIVKKVELDLKLDPATFSLEELSW
ncbi:MAG: outer membrane lipoprotein-sorting protein [Spirochaetales bacterium]|nr:outer membrane lipoprotein-sorting protein [Spirochaetales bacterium]